MKAVRIHRYGGPETLDVRDGRFTLPIGFGMPLRDAAHAHERAERCGAGKIIFVVQAAG